MCGIIGFIDHHNGTAQSAETITAMTDKIRHRGPDGSGVWIDKQANVALGHRRLSIVDLSPLGQQPMLSSDKRWIIIFNGEIYNFQDIRYDLERLGVTLKGHSDTEVLAEALAAWGAETTFGRLLGMFALAAYDTQSRKLYLCRDQLGIKPLYWGIVGGVLFFGSELKAFKPHPAWQPEINRNVAASYMRFGYVPDRDSIWHGIEKLEPGTFISIDTTTLHPTRTSYWSIEQSMQQGSMSMANFTSDKEATDALEALLTDAVQRQMVADVPLGAFLSGGIDSSTVVALMQKLSSQPVQTFSIGFEEEGYNEAIFAKEVANHLGTDHSELYVTPAEALEVVPFLSEMYDEPFADSSQIPTYIVSKFARSHVTVCLSGDGGDELFAGYSRYDYLLQLMQDANGLPEPVRKAIAGMIRAIPNPLLSLAGRILPIGSKADFANRIKNYAQGWATGPHDRYLQMLGHWQTPNDVVNGASEPLPLALSSAAKKIAPDMLSRMQYIDLKTYLAEDILTKVDRASMAVSLESRVPLLDHRLCDFAWSLPGQYKVRDGKSKWLLREVLYRHVPKELIDRPKMGFGVPIDSWLRGPLKEWAWSLLNPDTINKHGLLTSKPIQQFWDAHQKRECDWHYPLWTALMMQDWLEKEAEHK
jgi:asparagine synthase (glutamine-hydrolysing)